MRLLTLLACSVGLGAASPAFGAVIWADDFSTSRASAPNPYDYPGGAAGDDYTPSVGSGNTQSVTGGVFNVVDAGGNQSLFVVSGPQFSQTSFSAGNTITFSADLRVNSLLAAGGNSVPRFSLLSGNAATGSEVFTVGFGYGNFTSQPANSLGFYYGQSAGGAVGAGNGIGVNSPGFTFGTYDSGTAANNDTNDGADATDDFYRVVITATQGSTAITGSVTNLATNNVATFSGNASSVINWTGSTGDGFRISTGVGGTANFDVDNLSVNAVPEPASLAVVGLLGGTLLTRRRRR